MSAQNSYRIERNYKSEQGWSGWIDNDWTETGDTWQDAIKQWLDTRWRWLTCQVISETPSAPSRSGIIEIQLGPSGFYVGAKIKATLIENE